MILLYFFYQEDACKFREFVSQYIKPPHRHLNDACGEVPIPSFILISHGMLPHTHDFIFLEDMIIYNQCCKHD